MKEKRINFYMLSCYLLFVLGEIPISRVSQSGERTAFLAFIAAALLCIGLSLLWQYIIRKINLKSQKGISGILKFAILFFVSAFCVYTAVCVFLKICVFLSDFVLGGMSKWAIAVPLALIIIVLLLKPESVFGKISYTLFAVCVIIISAVFLISLDYFDIKNISLLQIPSLHTLFSQSLPYVIKFIPTVVILPLFFESDKVDFKNTVLSLFIAFCVTGLTVLTPFLTFGTGLSAIIDYPYLKAVSSVTLGNVFIRIDGFPYAAVFASCVAEIYISLKVAVNSVKYMINSLQKNQPPKGD